MTTTATPKQIEFAKQLGIPSPEKLTVKQCSEAIEKAKEEADKVLEERAKNLRGYPIGNLIDLASMKKESPIEFSAPCPTCGGRDRLHVNTQKNGFWCSHCHGRGKWQDPIEWLMFADGKTFLQALDALDGGTVAPFRLPTSTGAQPASNEWLSPEKQKFLQGAALKAEDQLLKPAGVPGVDYLQRRGIPLEIAKRWRVGFAYHTSKQSQPPRPVDCITFPYWGTSQGETVIKALHYAAIDREAAGWKYDFRGKRGLFGAWLLNPVANKTLILCEGEINAISISAAAGAGCDVLSFGSETPSENTLSAIASIAARYALVIIWADESENVQKVWEAAAAGCLAIHGIKSLHGQDANDLLVLGRLGEYMAVVREAAYKKAGTRIAMQYEKESDPAQKTRLYDADERLIDAELQRFSGGTIEATKAA